MAEIALKEWLNKGNVTFTKIEIRKVSSRKFAIVGYIEEVEGEINIVTGTQNYLTTVMNQLVEYILRIENE